MSPREIVTTSCGNGVTCPECRMTMYEVWVPSSISLRRVVQCLNRDCELCRKEFRVKDYEVVLIPLVPVLSSEAT